MNPFIYLDYAASTPLDQRVLKEMQRALELNFGNPSSTHQLGREAKAAIDLARAQVAELIHAEPSEIIWTSGATESNNLALKGIANLYQRKGKHIITMKTEHKSVLDTCQFLEIQGYQITYLTPQKNGLLEIEELVSSIRDDTILVSVMHVNNETGIMQDITRIAQITAARGIFLHVDAVQSIGKFPLLLDQIPIDLLSLCAHKIYGPKGIGALYVRKKPRVRLAPLIHGGGHEQGMRSGTLATHQIVGLGAALHLAKREMKNDYQHVCELRDHFLNSLLKIKSVHCNNDLAHCSPYILNVRFENMLAEAILAKLPSIAAATSSACQGKSEGSYVLRELGLNEEQMKSSVRFSFGRFSTNNEIDYAIQSIQDIFF